MPYEPFSSTDLYSTIGSRYFCDYLDRPAIIATPAYTGSARKGDLVEITKGEVKHTARAQERIGGDLYVADFRSAASFGRLVASGFSIRVVERAVVPLPTKPGYYTAHRAHPIGWVIYALSTRGEWYSFNWDGARSQRISEAEIRSQAGGRELVELTPAVTA
ncbi:hypothetical protein N1031_06800 [Herbiconiux moechotypicola]|uniref:Uncharacterized protein n=1 Tax=Herbiconiux moechotypicola TaxID=637393 RepID=A0ABN3DG09_9MICO|nr:hypothetical protein [Herbiconiux moechotypicola]MCS5729466.1 hypothetical protein [Herbiconiux moechotypicola]